MTRENIRVALFPCTYREIDGVANTSRQFAEFARERDYPFLLVHAGPSDEVSAEGSLTRIQLRRGRIKFPLDGHHEFDLLFLRHYSRILQIVRDFSPNVIHITGPSDVGILGALAGSQSGRHFGGLLANQCSSICPLPRVPAALFLAGKYFQ